MTTTGPKFTAGQRVVVTDTTAHGNAAITETFPFLTTVTRYRAHSSRTGEHTYYVASDSPHSDTSWVVYESMLVPAEDFIAPGEIVRLIHAYDGVPSDTIGTITHGGDPSRGGHNTLLVTVDFVTEQGDERRVILSAHRLERLGYAVGDKVTTKEFSGMHGLVTRGQEVKVAGARGGKVRVVLDQGPEVSMFPQDLTLPAAQASTQEEASPAQERVAKLEETVRSLESKIAEHERWKDRLTRDAHEMADRHDWCPTFDDFMDEHGLPRRSRTYSVEVSLTVTTTLEVSAHDEDAAEDGAQEQAEDGAFLSRIDRALRDLGMLDVDTQFHEVTEVREA